MSTGLDERAVTTPQASAPGHPAWRHALELGPVLTGAVFAAGTVLPMAKVPAVAVIVIAAAVAMGLTAAAAIMARSGYSAAWTASAAACGAGWLAYADIGGPWSWPAVTGLLVPAAILVPLWPAVRAHEEREAEAERRRLAALTAAEGARKWPLLLARIGIKGVQYVSREDTVGGYKVRLRLAAHGRVTYRTLAGQKDNLEVAAKVRRGSLRFEELPGDAAHEVILHVDEKDILGDTIPFPADSRRRSINDPIPVGQYQDGSVCTITLREVAVLIIGLRGSGKSNMLNVLIAQLARCVDVCIFVIDLKHRMARPWLEPWLQGKTIAPVIEWVATDRDEAEMMLQACLRAVRARMASGVGGEKLTPSIEHPAIILIVDEMALIFGQGTGGPRYSSDGTTNTQLATLGKQLVFIGRSEAIDLVLASQRGTVTMTGDGDLKSQCGLRIGLGMATEADARTVIPDNVRIAADLAALKNKPGTGIVHQGEHGRALPVKFYRIEQEDITRIAMVTGHIRPAPDLLLAGALGDAYATRWEERGNYLVPALPGKPSRRVVPPPGVDPGEFADIVSHLSDINLPFVVSDDEPTANPARRAMRDFIRRARNGVSPKMIGERLAEEGLPVARQTINRWLAEDKAAGYVEQSGRFGMWVWRA